MAWRVEKLFASLLLTVVLSVLFASCTLVIFPMNFDPAMEDYTCLFPFDGVLNLLRFHGKRCFSTLIQDISGQMVTSFYWITRIWDIAEKIFVETVDWIVFTDGALNWLNSCKIQLVCYIVIMFMVYSTYKENMVYSRLVKAIKTELICINFLWEFGFWIFFFTNFHDIMGIYYEY